jgi:thiamine pyrophosphate-dependent acetolactate synthase large subunit-like protein
MTFKEFESIVKENRPEITVFSHGEFAGNKINVAVIFNPSGHGKVYQYNGNYCNVLNKLGIKAIYSEDLWNLEMTLKRAIESNGQPNIFTDEPIDNSEDIARLKKEIAEIKRDYIIVRK